MRKCPYCDFNSHEWKGDTFPETEYLDALRADLEMALPLVWGRQVHTVFIGGGTPSLLSAAGLDRMLSDVRALLPLDADAEITLEANPGTFEAAKFAQFRASGVNRLSVGIQSFNEAHLKALGRIHDATQARHAVEVAANTFDNFNLDLMFALPQQTLARVSGRCGDGVVVRAAAFVAVSPDARTEHAVCEIPACAPRRRRVRRHAGLDSRTHDGRRL